MDGHQFLLDGINEGFSFFSENKLAATSQNNCEFANKVSFKKSPRFVFNGALKITMGIYYAPFIILLVCQSFNGPNFKLYIT